MTVLKDRVDWIKVGICPYYGVEFCTFMFKSEGWFVLWYPIMYTDEEISAFDSIKHSMWVSLIKEAIAHDLEISIETEGGYSSVVTIMKLNAP